MTSDKLISALLGVIIAGMGYWVNAQEEKIKEVSEEVKAMSVEVFDQKLSVVQDIGAIKTQQALDSQTQEQILKAIQELRQEIKEP